MPSRLLPCLVLLAAAILAANHASAGPRRLAVSWNDRAFTGGVVQAMNPAAPWTFDTAPLTVGRNPLLRAAFGSLYSVSDVDNSVDVIDIDAWSVDKTIALPAGSHPLDIAVVSPETAYITRKAGTKLLRLNLSNGETEEVVDLSIFADEDGAPDLGMMAEHDGRLFVQIRRERHGEFSYVPPAYLAVVELATEQLIDVDPVRDGVQAIQLAGTAPKLKMQVMQETNQLFVGATGGGLDDGGIEAIDLMKLKSQGLIVEEAQRETGLDLGGFVMTSPEQGYLTYTTDLTISSHLHRFSSSGEVDPEQLHVGVGFLASTLVFDQGTNSVYFPHGGDISESGVHVFNATTGEYRNRNVIATPGATLDMVMVCEPATAMTAVIGAAMGIPFVRPWRKRPR